MQISKRSWVVLGLTLVASAGGVWSALKMEPAVPPPPTEIPPGAVAALQPSPSISPDQKAESKDVDEIRTTAQGLTCLVKGQNIFETQWSGLKEVALIVKIESPKKEDIRWRFTAKEGASCLFSMDLPSAYSLLDDLGKLPDFSSREVIEAMNSKQDGTFVVYETL